MMTSSADPKALIRAENKNFYNYPLSSLTSRQEQQLYENCCEQEVPPQIEGFHSFFQHHNIPVVFHRKPKTIGCEEAIAARAMALNNSALTVADELKALMLATHDNNPVLLLMPGDRDAINYPKIRGKIALDALSEIAGVTITGIHDDKKRFVHGRINPVSLRDEARLIIAYDDSLLQTTELMYTNAGMNTWGAAFNIMSVLHALLKDGITCRSGNITQPQVSALVAVGIITAPQIRRL